LVHRSHQSLPQIEVGEQRRKRFRHMLDDLAAHPDGMRRRRLPGDAGEVERGEVGQRGDRPRLQNGDLAAGEGPFDIHRHAVMGFDLPAELGEGDGRLIVQHRSILRSSGTGSLRRAGFE
jgi:hypothetical protein